MGNNESPIYNIRGEEIKNKRCIVVVTPPSYEVRKLISKIPPDLGYEFVSIGQMIRDEINKKTNYSKLIVENLERDKKINEKILDILLKNATLIGNFVIKYAPIDEDQADIWKKFIAKANLHLVIIVHGQTEESVAKRPSYRLKLEQYQKDVESIRKMTPKNLILEVDSSQQALDFIGKRLKEDPK